MNVEKPTGTGHSPVDAMAGSLLIPVRFEGTRAGSSEQHVDSVLYGVGAAQRSCRFEFKTFSQRPTTVRVPPSLLLPPSKLLPMSPIGQTQLEARGQGGHCCSPYRAAFSGFESTKEVQKKEARPPPSGSGPPLQMEPCRHLVLRLQ